MKNEVEQQIQAAEQVHAAAVTEAKRAYRAAIIAALDVQRPAMRAASSEAEEIEIDAEYRAACEAAEAIGTAACLAAATVTPIHRNPNAGPKWQSGHDVATTAKMIRADIKAAIASHHLPAGTYSVRISRFSGGQSLDVRISGLPFVVLSRERIARGVLEPHAYPSGPLWSDVGAEVLRRVERIVGAYNRDQSDTQTDYFDVDFYGHVSFDGSWERAQRDAMAAQIRAAQ